MSFWAFLDRRFFLVAPVLIVALLVVHDCGRERDAKRGGCGVRIDIDSRDAGGE